MNEDKRKALAVIGIFLVVLLLGLVYWALPAEAQEVSEYGILVQNNEKILIEDANLILTGNIIVKDNGTLILKGSTIQLSIRGEEDYNVTVSGNGKIILENSRLMSLSETSKIILADEANLTLRSGSSLDGFAVLTSNGTALIAVQDGKLNVDRISGRLSLLRLEKTESFGTIEVEADAFYTSGFTGSSVNVKSGEATLSDSKFKSLTLNVSNMVKLSRVEAGEALTYSAGKFRLEDSSFERLTLRGVGEVYNVVTKSGPALKAGGQIYALPNSTVKRFWYLTVTVTDIAGVAVPAKILLYYVNGTKALEVEADIPGKAYTPVLAEIVNSTKTLFVGNYLVKAIYLNHSTSFTRLTMDSNKDLKLRFNAVIPIPTTTHLGVSQLKLKVGEKLKVSGWIDPPRVGELVEITYKRPDGGEVKRAVKTAEGGRFTDEFTPDTSGSWTVYADWLGGSAYVEGKQTTSRPVTFIVEARPPLHAIVIRIMPILIVVIALVIGLAYLALQKRRIT